MLFSFIEKLWYENKIVYLRNKAFKVKKLEGCKIKKLKYLVKLHVRFKMNIIIGSPFFANRLIMYLSLFRYLKNISHPDT